MSAVMEDRQRDRPDRQTDGEPRLPLPEDPVIEAYKAHVDRTLLRENLRRTVQERIDNLVELQRFAAEVRSAGDKSAPS